MLNILAVLCPPLAVMLTEGPGLATANLGLTLLFYVPGLLHARSVIEQHSLERRYATVMRTLELRRVM